MNQFYSFVSQANNTPFWKKRFQKVQVDIDANELSAQIYKLPILTKQEVRGNINSTINPTLPEKKLKKVQTSGTTAAGLIFYQPQSMANAPWAVWWRYRKWHGISP